MEIDIKVDKNYKIRSGVAPCGRRTFQKRTIVRSGRWVLKNKANGLNRVYIGSNGNMGTIIAEI